MQIVRIFRFFLLLWVAYGIMPSQGLVVWAQSRVTHGAVETLQRFQARAHTSFGRVERWEGFRFDNINPRTVEV
ncbi:MAG: hypothetical protein ACKOX4_13765, partial [Bacteroidota bacterium]